MAKTDQNINEAFSLFTKELANQLKFVSQSFKAIKTPMSSLNKLKTVIVVAGLNKLTDGLKNLNKTMNLVRQSFTKSMSGLFSGVMSLASSLSKFLISSIFNTASTGFKDVQTARNVGLTAYDMEAWKYVAKQENVSSDTFTSLAGQIQEAKYDPSKVAPFAQLGGNVASLITGGASTQAIMQEVFNRLSDLGKSSGGRTIATMDLKQLGLNFDQFSFLLDGGNTQLEAYINDFKKLHPLNQQQLQQQKNLQVSLNTLWTTIQNVTMQLATAFSPITQALTSWLSNLVNGGSNKAFASLNNWAKGVAENLPSLLNSMMASLESINWGGVAQGFQMLQSALTGVYAFLVNMGIVKASTAFTLDRGVSNLTSSQIAQANPTIKAFSKGGEAGLEALAKTSGLNQIAYSEGLLDYDSKLNSYVTASQLNSSDVSAGKVYKYKKGESQQVSNVTNNNFFSPNYASSQNAQTQASTKLSY